MATSKQISRAMRINASEARVRFLTAIAVSGFAEDNHIQGDDLRVALVNGQVNPSSLFSSLFESLSTAVQEIAAYGVILPHTVATNVNLWRSLPLLWAEILEYIQITHFEKYVQLLSIRDYFLIEKETILRFAHLVNAIKKRIRNQYCSVHPYLSMRVIDNYRDMSELSYSPLLVRSIGHTCFLLESIVFSRAGVRVRDFYYFSLGSHLEAGKGSNSIAERLIEEAGGKTFYINDDLPLSTYRKVYLGDHISNNICIFQYGELYETQLCGRSIAGPVSSLTDCGKRAFRQNSFTSLLGSRKLLPKLTEFVESTPTGRLIALHHRDSAFTGNGQNWRDTNLIDYAYAIESLVADGFRVVMMNPYPASDISVVENTNVFSLKGTDFSLWDQLYVIHKASLLIGTASGISHWWVSSGLPTVMVNTVALPASPIGQGVIHIPKRLHLRNTIAKLSANGRVDLVKALLSSTWDGPVWKYLEVTSYSGSELKGLIYDAIDEFGLNAYVPTSHNLLKSLGLTLESVPDYFISKRAFRYMHEICSKIIWYQA